MTPGTGSVGERLTRTSKIVGACEIAWLKFLCSRLHKNVGETGIGGLIPFDGGEFVTSPVQGGFACSTNVGFYSPARG